MHAIFPRLALGHRHEHQRQRDRIRVAVAGRPHVPLLGVLSGNVPAEGRRPEAGQPFRIVRVHHQMHQARGHALTPPSEQDTGKTRARLACWGARRFRSSMTGRDDLLGLFPPGTVQDQDGMLRIGGCRLDDLADAYGTPVLVMAEQPVRQRARDYREQLAARWPDPQVLFASKAFPCTAVQRLMVSEGLWLDVAGGGEIVTALAAGADPATLVLHGNAKTTEEIVLAVGSGVGTVVVDNEDDIDRLEAVVPPGRVQGCLVRVIPGVDSSTYPAYATGHAGSKFGLSPAAARRAISRIRACARLRMDGLHTHVGSQILVAEELAAAVAPLAALGDYPVYDLGGGLGCRYTYADHPPGLAEYLDALTGAARAHLPAGARILIEPGRSMVAPSAVTLYRG